MSEANITNKSWPKISIVTPNYNMDSFLEATIKSIVDQGYPNLEYIIIDGGSTDNSVEIIKKYDSQLTYWISEPDRGMYHAIQKGFIKSTGEIMGWLNSDDMLHPKSLFILADTFSQLSVVEWIQGIPTQFDQEGRTVKVFNFRTWSKFQFYQKEYKWIQQESTFWRRSLWIRSGKHIDAKLKYAGDLELWTRFFRHAQLFSLDALIGGFRIRPGEQLSSNIQAYHSEAEEILEKEVKVLNKKDLRALNKIITRKKCLKFLSKTRFLNTNGLANRFIKPLYEFPPIVNYDHKIKRFYLKNQGDKM